MPLTANANRTFELGDINEYPLAANAVVYEGAAIGNNGAGFARPLQAGDPFLGFADRSANNTSGSAGAATVRTKFRGLIRLAVTGLVQSSLGALVYASDDGTFTMTASTNTPVGRVHRVESNGVGVVRFGLAAN
jgi:hypothetical protein